MKGIKFVLATIWNWIVVMVEAVTKDAYLSTRISRNKLMGWTIAENKILSFDREAYCRITVELNVLNPVRHQVDGWTERMYMTMWRTVIRIMAAMGKVMISYDNDLPWSRGCTEEVNLAKEIHMRIIKGNTGERGIAKKVYVDWDGTMVPDWCNSIYMRKVKEVGTLAALAWYEKNEELWDRTMELNKVLLFTLLAYKAKGYKIIIWTNRFPCQEANMKRNLGAWIYLFDDFQFHCGFKSKIKLDGILYDNDPKYATNAPEFHLVNFNPKGGD